MFCNDCTPATAYTCHKTLIFDVGLDPNKEYSVHITDKHGRVYIIFITTEADGTLILDINDAHVKSILPSHYFNSFGGIYLIEFYDETTYSSDPVNCISLAFLPDGDSSLANTIHAIIPTPTPVAGSIALEDLSNVNTTGKLDGYVLSWDVTISKWIASSTSGIGWNIASQAEAEAGVDNTKIMTPLRVAQKLAHWLINDLPNAAITWAAKQIFTLAPRLSSANASEYLKTDSNKDITSVSSIPAADITESSTKKFVPQPTADSDFLVGQATGNVWVKKTLAEVKTILGITTPSASCVLTTTNQTGINNTASFIDITDLNFSADANSMYFIHWIILVTTTASNGFRVALTTPSGSSMEVVRSWYGTDSSNVMNSDDYMGASQFTNIGAYWVRFEGYVKTGATAGTVQGRIITSNVANVLTVRAGSGGLVTKKS